MKKFVFISLAASLFAYNVTSNSDNGATLGTLRYGFVNSQSPMDFTSGVQGVTFSASSVYTANVKTILNTIVIL